MRGTLLNTAAVAGGASLGMLAGSNIPHELEGIALGGLGLIVAALGIKSFLQSKSILVVTASVVFGGLAGALLRIDPMLQNFTELVRQQLGGGAHFNEGLIGASILFCVGPMALLGCIEDGLEGKIDLLTLKSTLDGVAAFFLATALGRDGGLGVLLSALVVLVVQGALTLAARPLRPLAQNAELMAEATATGGILLIAIGLRLLQIKQLPVADYLPALVFAPLFVLLLPRLSKSGKASAQA